MLSLLPGSREILDHLAGYDNYLATHRSAHVKDFTYSQVAKLAGKYFDTHNIFVTNGFSNNGDSISKLKIAYDVNAALCIDDSSKTALEYAQRRDCQVILPIQGWNRGITYPDNVHEVKDLYEALETIKELGF